VNPHCAVIRVSATSGEGFGAWYDWLAEQQASVTGAAPMAAPALVAR
jgi:hydrogenase nickel incorporation protein HypB